MNRKLPPHGNHTINGDHSAIRNCEDRHADDRWYAAVCALIADNEARPDYQQCSGQIVSVLPKRSIEYIPRFDNCNSPQCHIHGDRACKKYADRLVTRWLCQPIGVTLYFVTITPKRYTRPTLTLKGFKQAVGGLWRDLHKHAREANRPVPVHSSRLISLHGQWIHAHAVIDWLPEPTPYPTHAYPDRLHCEQWERSAARSGLRLHLLPIKNTVEDYRRVANYLAKNLRDNQLERGSRNTVFSRGWKDYILSPPNGAPNGVYGAKRENLPLITREYLSELLLRYEQKRGNMSKLRTCSKCGKQYPATTDYFQRAGPGRLRGMCKVCSSQYDQYRDRTLERRLRKSTKARRLSEYAAQGIKHPDAPEDMPIAQELPLFERITDE